MRKLSDRDLALDPRDHPSRLLHHEAERATTEMVPMTLPECGSLDLFVPKKVQAPGLSRTIRQAGKLACRDFQL